MGLSPPAGGDGGGATWRPGSRAAGCAAFHDIAFSVFVPLFATDIGPGCSCISSIWLPRRTSHLTPDNTYLVSRAVFQGYEHHNKHWTRNIRISALPWHNIVALSQHTPDTIHPEYRVRVNLSQHVAYSYIISKQGQSVI